MAAGNAFTGFVRREISPLLELTGISALIFAQPVFDVVQNAPEELVARQARPGEIVLFAALVVLGPPLIAWLAEFVIGLVSGEARTVVHRLLLALGGGVFAVEVAKLVFDVAPGRRLWLLGAVAAGLMAALVTRDGFRQVLRYLALAGPAFAALFLFASPVANLVIGRSVDAAPVEVGEPAPVVFLVLDELPTVSLLDGTGAIDDELYPNFARLADQSTFFRNHTSVAPLTPAAVPALLTGQLPDDVFPAPVASTFDESLFTLLGDTYDVEATETLTEICPPGICESTRPASSAQVVRSLVDTGWEVFGSVASPRAEAADLTFSINRTPEDPEAGDKVTDLADRIARRSSGASLDFLHVLLPHQPFDLLASGAPYEAPDPPRGAEFGEWQGPAAARQAQQRHLLQLEYTDRLLGELLDGIQAGAAADETLLIVTADHGISFTAGQPLRAVSEANFHEIMWTPLFVHTPGQSRGAVDDTPVETIDIVPTVAEVLEVDLPWEVDGQSVFAPDRDDTDPRMIDWRFHEIDADPATGFVTVDGDEGIDRVLDAANPAVGREGPYRVIGAGPYRRNLGRPVDDFTVGPPHEVEVELELPATLMVPEGEPSRPAYTQGIWTGPELGWVFVAIDGRLEGVGRSVDRGFGVADVWVVAREGAVGVGDHELRLYAAEGDGDEMVLRPLPVVDGPDGSVGDGG